MSPLHRSFRSLPLVLAVATVLAGCGRTAEQSPAADAPAPAAAASPAATVAYEPAFPADVSAEGLSATDAAQQETPHSHEGGEEHTHAEEKADEGDHGHPH
jgi:hypothetical protein